MGNLTLNGSSSGQITISPPAVAGTNTITLPAVTGTVLTSAGISSLPLNGASSGTTTLIPASVASGTVTIPSGTGTIAVQGVSTNIVQGTSVASTSGTSISFTSLPAWVKRITVMLQGVSTSGSSNKLIQLGTSGGFVTTGYLTTAVGVNTGGTVTQFSSGWAVVNTGSTDLLHGKIVLDNLTSNTWVGTGQFNLSNAGTFFWTEGSISSASLGGVLTQVRVTTVNGTDTFTAGNINIFYE